MTETEAKSIIEILQMADDDESENVCELLLEFCKKFPEFCNLCDSTIRSFYLKRGHEMLVINKNRVFMKSIGGG